MGSENKTHLGAGGPPRWVVASLATVPALGGQPWPCGLPGLVSASVQGLSWLTEMISSLAPDSDGEGAGAATKDSIWAVIGPQQGWDDAAAVHPDEGAAQKIRRELLWKQAAGVVFARRLFAGDPTKNQ
jgi:hypothetical protein